MIVTFFLRHVILLDPPHNNLFYYDKNIELQTTHHSSMNTAYSSPRALLFSLEYLSSRYEKLLCGGLVLKIFFEIFSDPFAKIFLAREKS